MHRFEPDCSAAVHDLRTVRDFVRWAVTCLTRAEVYLGHGTDDLWDEALALVLHPLALDWDSDPRVMDARLTVPEREAVTELVRRRAVDRVPLPYLTGKAWFAGLPFHVDERVLVPRSSIAELITARFEPWLEPSRVGRVLELCTGSGCIAVACCHAFPEAEVVATDISADALDVATENRALHHCDEQLALVQGDLYAGVHGRYDLIIANPPYVDAADMDALPPEYRHEPELGLAAGHDGLDLVLRILADAERYLSDDGLLVVEVGNSDKALMAMFPVVPFIWPEFEQGEGGVFMLQAADVCAAAVHFRAAAAARA